MTYEDHFSGHAHAYARHRPRYPDELFSWLASQSPERALAWDAGTGNGQVAIAVAELFERVVATDASADQLAHAIEHPRVEYRNESADHGSLNSASVDLITAGAAAHWFELDGFYREAQRVGKSGAVIALFSYGPRDFADAYERLFDDPIVHHFQENVLAGFWPERIQLVHDRYTTIHFPFEEIAAPTFTMTADWNLHELIAFLDTWSASQRYFQERGAQATDAIAPELKRTWSDPANRRHFECPLFVRAGRV
ncbi:MAG: class I SAM-dependent methyltransferase [Acidobacteriota bacterium]|nr:class I SAM-dependent methyltransferase [Acidobacteriota bacterium]